nr:MAG TPA: Fatty acid cis/trans isomerase (CTI) [Caudoviricetes sp.]
MGKRLINGRKNKNRLLSRFIYQHMLRDIYFRCFRVSGRRRRSY